MCDFCSVKLKEDMHAYLNILAICVHCSLQWIGKTMGNKCSRYHSKLLKSTYACVSLGLYQPQPTSCYQRLKPCSPCQWIGDKPYMNCKAIGNEAYVPTDLEHLANIVTHGLWVLPSFLGLNAMIQQASTRKQMISAVVYGILLVALFLISTIFHSVFYIGRHRSLKDLLHRCDRAVIYLFIAASYTPWLTLKPIEPGLGVHVRWLVWVFACFGIIYQQMFHERYKWLETVFYLLLGLVPAVVIFKMPEWSGLFELAIGGGIYIFGIYFFKSDGHIPCAHAIWHIFVIIGATFHFYAVCKYLLGKQNENQTFPILS